MLDHFELVGLLPGNSAKLSLTDFSTTALGKGKKGFKLFNNLSIFEPIIGRTCLRYILLYLEVKRYCG